MDEGINNTTLEPVTEQNQQPPIVDQAPQPEAGQPIAEQHEAEQPMAEPPASEPDWQTEASEIETPMDTQANSETPMDAQSEIETPLDTQHLPPAQPPRDKASKTSRLVSILAAVVILVAGLGWLGWKHVFGQAILQQVKGPGQYFVDLEGAELKTYAARVNQTLKENQTRAPKPMQMDAGLSIAPGEALDIPENVLAYLNGLTIQQKSYVNDGQTKHVLTLADAENAFPDIVLYALKDKLALAMPGVTDAIVALQERADSPEIDTKKLQNSLDALADALMDSLKENGEFSFGEKEKVAIGQVSVKATRVTCTVQGKGLRAVAADFLAAVKSDEYLCGLLADYANAQKDFSGMLTLPQIETDFGEDWADWDEKADDAEQSDNSVQSDDSTEPDDSVGQNDAQSPMTIQGVRDLLQEGIDEVTAAQLTDEDQLIWTSDVNQAGRVVGRRVEVSARDDEQTLTAAYICTKKLGGPSAAAMVSYGDTNLLIECVPASATNGRVNVVVKAGEETLSMHVDYRDVKLKKWQGQAVVTGSLTLIVDALPISDSDAEVLEGVPVSQLLSESKVTLELSLDKEKYTATCTANLSELGDFTLTAQCAPLEGDQSFTLPDTSQAITLEELMEGGQLEELSGVLMLEAFKHPALLELLAPLFGDFFG